MGAVETGFLTVVAAGFLTVVPVAGFFTVVVAGFLAAGALGLGVCEKAIKGSNNRSMRDDFIKVLNL